MSSSPPLSRYGLPLLAVLLVHGLLLALMGRGLRPPAPPPPSPLEVALLGPAAAAPGTVVASAALPTEAASAAPTVPEPSPPSPVAPPTAAAPLPPASPALPGRPLQAPLADAVPAAALADPLPPPAPGPGAAPLPAAGSAGSRGDVEARLAPGTPEPAYPEDARLDREEGSVTLQLQVRADGRVRAVKVLRSSGSPRLDRAARDAAWRWRVLPAEREGRPVDSLFEKTLHFRLED